MSDIFLSYKSENRAQAKIIAETIEKYGYSVWWDRIIPPGKTFDEVIEGALDAAKCVVALWSKESVSSDWVKNEVREGTRRHILVPVLIDNAKIPFEFRHIQAAQLIDWQGEMPNPEFELLLRSIGEIVGRPPVAITKTEPKLKVDSEMEKVPEVIETKINQTISPQNPRKISDNLLDAYRKVVKVPIPYLSKMKNSQISSKDIEKTGILLKKGSATDQEPNVEKKYCQECGHPFILGDKYCEECGSNLS
jgi:hypothetical protein